MQEKIILLRDHSKESKEAEKILQEHAIEHAQLFLKPGEGRVPCLLTPDVAYKGFDNITGFIQGKK